MSEAPVATPVAADPPAGPAADRPGGPPGRIATVATVVAGLVAIGAIATALLALARPDPARTGEAVTVIADRVEWILADTEAPPTDASRWSQARLPLAWSAPGDTLARAWFRLRFERPATREATLAVYMPKLGNGGTVWVNGMRIGDVRTMDADTQVRWFRPFLFPIDAALLREGANEIVVRQQSRDARNVFRGAAVGPIEPLRDRHDWLLFWQRTTATLAAWFCGVVGTFLIVLWTRRREEVLSAVFGASCLMWSLRSLSFVVETMPLELWFAWRTVYYVATGGFIATMAIGLVRFAGGSSRALVPIALGYWALGPLAFVVGGWPVRDWIDRVWILGFVPFMLYAVARLAHAWWRERRGTQLLLLAAVAGATAMALHDYLVALDPGLLPTRSFFGMHLAAPIVLAALGVHLLDRFVRSLQQSEALAQGLERRVAERERELARNFERLRALEREREVTDERQRIMREMHDGVGSQLLTSLAMVERGAADRDDVARMLRECLDDMRLAIDTLAPESADLAGALGNLRYRFAPRLEAMGVASRWDLASLPDPLPVTPHQTLQMLRIVQESLANVLKHARARTVSVSAVVADGRLAIEVVDDGVGFDAHAPTQGRGLRNMRRRAAESGASLQVGPRPGAAGTRVSIERALPAT